ncbi:MAG: efflux RND transporter periplasmic adaptor subunit [Pirellulales bacterium]
MSFIPAARRTLFWLRPKYGLAPRSGRRRWCARAVGGAMIAGAAWCICIAVSVLVHRGAIAVPVKRGDLVISVSGDGAVESGMNLEIKCRVRGSMSLLDVVPDGARVRKGDVLVRLDSTSLKDAIASEKLVLANCEAAVARAKKNLRAAEIAIEEYREGTYIEQRLRIERDILTAQQSLAAAQRSLLESQIMFRRAFVSRLHVEAREFAVELAESKLASAKLKRDVLDEFTRAKVLKELTSKRDTVAARLKSDEATLWRHTDRLKRLEDDLTNCVIRAPRDGMAVYPSETVGGRGGTSQPAPAIYPGALVRQHQRLVHLADLSLMQIKLLVGENKLGPLRRGQRARLRVLDQELAGAVASIADRPDATLVVGDNSKRYAVGIALDEEGERLKPGMTAEVEIVVKRKQNVLMIPLLCVLGERDHPRVLVKKLGRLELRDVMLGIANDAFVEVIDGVKEGELILLNPAKSS